MDKRVAIIVLNWNGKEDTKQCLLSLQRLTYPHAEIILIDNGSTDGSRELFRSEFPKIRLVETGINLGFAGGNNVGLRIALKEGFDFTLVLNNDTTVDPGLIEGFLEGFRDEDVGIAGAKIFRMDSPTQLDHLGGKWNEKKIDFDYVGYRAEESECFDQNLQLDYVCGAALMIRKEVLETVGLFDPRFFLFWEEADLCFRAKRAGYEISYCPKATVWHKVSASFVGGKPHAAYFFERNKLLWIEKNYVKTERIVLLTRLLGIQLPKFLYEKILRETQYLYQRFTKKNYARNQERIARIDAAIYGMLDYCLRRFWEGHSKKFMNCQ